MDDEMSIRKHKQIFKTPVLFLPKMKCHSLWNRLASIPRGYFGDELSSAKQRSSGSVVGGLCNQARNDDGTQARSSRGNHNSFSQRSPHNMFTVFWLNNCLSVCCFVDSCFVDRCICRYAYMSLGIYAGWVYMPIDTYVDRYTCR